MARTANIFEQDVLVSCLFLQWPWTELVGRSVAVSYYYYVSPMHTLPDLHSHKLMRSQFDMSVLELGTALATNNWVL